MAKIFSWKINSTNKYAYLCFVPNPDAESGSHITNGRIDDIAILNNIVSFLKNKNRQDIIDLYNEMYEEVTGRFGSTNLPSPDDYDTHFEKFWSLDASSNNVILLSGKDGVNGLDGLDGAGGGSGSEGSGQQGPAGPRGPIGLTGPKGDDGNDGQDGRDGVDGINGENAPYYVDYYFSTSEEIEPDNDGHPRFNGIVATVSRSNGAVVWYIDSEHSGICSTTPQLVDPNNTPYRYVTQAYNDGNNFVSNKYDGHEFSVPVLDAACPSLSDAAINQIKDNIEGKVTTAMTQALATIEETNRLFDGVQERLEQSETILNEAKNAAENAVAEAANAVNQANELARSAEESINNAHNEISSAIDSFSGVVAGVSSDTHSLRAEFVEFGQDYEAFSGVMTEFAVSASGIFQVSLLATSGLTSAMTMAHEFNSTVDGLVSRLSGCTISGDSISRSINEFTQDLEGLHVNCSGMSAEVDALSAKTANWEMGINGLQGRMEQVERDKDTISGSTMELEASINGIHQNLTSVISGSAINLESKTAELDASIDGLYSKLTDVVSADTGVVELRTSSLEQRVDSLKSEMDETVTTDGGSVAYKTSKLEQTVDGLQLTASNLQTSATSISSQTMDLIATIGGISAEFDEAYEDANTFHGKLMQLSASTSGIKTQVSEHEEALNGEGGISNRISTLEQTVTGFDISVIENLSGNVVSNINNITAQGNKITALSATTSGTAAVVNEMRSDYNQFVVSSAEWKKKSDGTFVAKSWNEDDVVTYGYDYIGEPTPIRQYVYYAKDSGVWPQCLYGRYIAGTNVIDKYNKTLVFENEIVPYDYTAAVSGWFYTNKEETQIFDGNIRRGGPTGEIITNIYTSKHHCLTTDEILDVNINVGYLGYGSNNIYVPDEQAGYTEAHWKNSYITSSNPGLTHGGNVVLTDLLYMLTQDSNAKDYSINYDGTLANVRGFSSAEYNASRWETYYDALTSGTTTVCGGDISVADFIVKYCYSVISQFSGVKQTPDCINAWVSNKNTAAQVALGINKTTSIFDVRADNIQLRGNVIASALTAYTGQIGGINFQNKTITSTNWDGNSNGFKIDMANGIITANAIYLGGGTSGSTGGGSGIQMDTEYGEGENTYQFSSDGLISAKNAILEGGLIGGILIHENNIESKNFSLRGDGRIFANGLDVAGQSLILNDNEMLFMKNSNPVVNITNKSYNKLPDFVNPESKNVGIVPISNSADLLIFSGYIKTTASTKTAKVKLGGDKFKGWLDIASAVTRSLSSVGFSGNVEYQITLDTVNKTASGGWSNGSGSYGYTVSNNGGYGSDDGNSSDNSTNYNEILGDIYVSYVSSDQASPSNQRSITLYGDGSTFRTGNVRVNCTTGYSWVATSNSGLLIQNDTGENGGSFTILVPEGSSEGIYYVDVEYKLDADNLYHKSAQIVVILYSNLTYQIAGTTASWLNRIGSSSGRKVAKEGKLPEDDMTLSFLTKSELNPRTFASPYKNMIDNEEEETRSGGEVLGNVVGATAYEIKLNESNVFLLKGQEYDKTITISGGTLTGVTGNQSESPKTLSITIPIDSSFTLNKSLEERILSIGSDLNGEVNLTANTGNLCEIKVVYKVILKSGFSLQSIPLAGFTEIFTNGLGYYGDEKNYAALVESRENGLMGHIVSKGAAYPYTVVDLDDEDDGGWFIMQYSYEENNTVHVDEWQAIRLSSFGCKRNLIIKSTYSNANDPADKVTIQLPSSDAEEELMDLKPGDNFHIIGVHARYGNVTENNITYNIGLELDVVNRDRNVVLYDNSSNTTKTSYPTTGSGRLATMFSVGKNKVVTFDLVYLGKVKNGAGAETSKNLWYISRDRYFYSE